MASERAGGWRSLSRRNAFLIHLALSILIFMTLVMVMVNLWFPGKLFFLDGGWEGLKIVALIDIVLGPALTLLLFIPEKKGVLFDMVCIAVFQVAALGYGFYTTYTQRAIAVVYSGKSFDTLSQGEYELATTKLKDFNKEARNVAALDNRKPAMLAIEPHEKGSNVKYTEDLLNGYPQIHDRADKYFALAGNTDLIRKGAVSDKALKYEDTDGLVKRALAKQKPEADIDVVRFTARYGSGFALFDHSEGKIVDYIRIDKSKTKAVKADKAVAKKTPTTATGKTEVAESPE